MAAVSSLAPPSAHFPRDRSLSQRPSVPLNCTEKCNNLIGLALLGHKTTYLERWAPFLTVISRKTEPVFEI